MRNASCVLRNSNSLGRPGNREISRRREKKAIELSSFLKLCNVCIFCGSPRAVITFSVAIQYACLITRRPHVLHLAHVPAPCNSAPLPLINYLLNKHGILSVPTPTSSPSLSLPSRSVIPLARVSFPADVIIREQSPTPTTIYLALHFFLPFPLSQISCKIRDIYESRRSFFSVATR